MKRVLLLWVFFLLFVALKVNGQEVEVSSFSYLRSLLESNSPQTILLSTGTIVFESNYNDIGIGLKTLRGNNSVLDGRNHTGLRSGRGQNGVGYGEYLNISDVTIQNFSSYLSSFGGQRGTLALVNKFIFNASGKVNFVKNKTENDGGAIFAGILKEEGGWSIKRGDIIANFEEGEFEFVGNTAREPRRRELAHITEEGKVVVGTIGGAAGGAVYANREARINFSNSKVKFTRNRSDNGGGLYIDDNAIATFNNCIVNLDYGIALYGGAICVERGANIAFKDSEVNFTGNGSGGASLLEASMSGGAIYTRKARIDFDNSKINFSMNKSCMGGVICVDRNVVIFHKLDSPNNENNNIATKICVNSSEVSFTSNSAAIGGAIFMENEASIISSNSQVSFTSNSVTNKGGAIFMEDEASIIFSNSQVSFVGNTAIKSDGHDGWGHGGAIYAINSNIKLNGSTRFIDNQAGRKGGVICAINSNIKLNGSTRFIDNQAGKKGGAIYMQGGVLDIETDEGKTSEFRGNRANGKSNAIHFIRDASIKFNIGSRGIVNMYDAITSQDEGGVVNINGQGEFNLSSQEESEIEYVNINDKSIFNVGAGSQLKVRETLRIGQRAMFNTVKGRKKVLKVKEYVQEGTLRMEIKREEGKEQIKARRLVRLGSRSKLKVERTGNYRGQAYMLIKYGRLEGRFGQLEIPQEHEIEYGYEGKWIALIPKRRRLAA